MADKPLDAAADFGQQADTPPQPTPDTAARQGAVHARVVPPGTGRPAHSTRAGRQKVYVPATAIPAAPPPPPETSRPPHVRRTGQQKVYVPADAGTTAWLRPQAAQSAPPAQPAPEGAPAPAGAPSAPPPPPETSRPPHVRRTGQQKVYVSADAGTTAWLRPQAAQSALPAQPAPEQAPAPAGAPSAPPLEHHGPAEARPAPRPAPPKGPATGQKPSAGADPAASEGPTAPRHITRPASGPAPQAPAMPSLWEEDGPADTALPAAPAGPVPAPAPGSAPKAAPAAGAKARPPRRGDRVYLVLMALFGLAFLVSGGMLLKRMWEDRQAEDQFTALQTMTLPAAPAASGGAAEDTGSDNAALFAALHEKNSDFVGWIRIDDTRIDYPVMYAPDREDYYLKRDFDGKSSSYGVPYIEEQCTFTEANRSNNLVIYGHHMKTGTMFSDLTNYRRAGFYEEHPVITFDTLYGDADYEVFAAFAIDVTLEADFAYNTYTDLDPETFAWFVDAVCARSNIKTDIRPAYGDELITLSTCEYSTADGRYVVCARRIREPQEG